MPGIQTQTFRDQIGVRSTSHPEIITTSIPMLPDELNATLLDALHDMSEVRKASLLLEAALDLIDSGRYGEKTERYLEVFLKTPGVSTVDARRAQLARADARRRAAERLLARAQEDYRAVSLLDPSNHEVRGRLSQGSELIHFLHEPGHTRTPLEIWDRIASYIPRYHLRTWLFLSSSHREIAQRRVFHTVDVYFGEDQMDNVHKGLDFFSRVKRDGDFAKKVKTLRVHWAYEEGDMLDIMLRLFWEALPSFVGVTEFEWIGYPELQVKDVDTILHSHPGLASLGLVGWHFDADGVSKFRSLRKFTLRAEDDDGYASMGEVYNVLESNASSLRHLCLGAYLKRKHSWDRAFESVSIKNLTRLDLVDTRISHVVLSRIAHAQNLESLTLHGTFEDPVAASVIFGSDHIIDARHTFLPLLKSFRFVVVGHDDDRPLFQCVTRFLRRRPKLCRLDLGTCPWDYVQEILTGAETLRVLRLRIVSLDEYALLRLKELLNPRIVALHISSAVCDRHMEEYAYLFNSFCSLGILHLYNSRRRHPQRSCMSEKEFQVQNELWYNSVRKVARDIPSLDFVGWHGEHFIVIRSQDVIEIKELPAKRRLDCGTGVDLGGEDAAWMERKDVPIDYEIPGFGADTT